MNNYFKLVLLLASIGSIACQYDGIEDALRKGQGPRAIGKYEQCEGKDAGNYTFISNSLDNNIADFLIQCLPNGERKVNELAQLARSTLPAGANVQIEVLWLIRSGPLQGKYLYLRVIHLSPAYLKQYSSVLGLSAYSTDKAQLLISEKLDPNILVAPNGAFEAFKRSCTTICTGKEVNV